CICVLLQCCGHLIYMPLPYTTLFRSPKQAAKSTANTSTANDKLTEAQVNEKMVDIYAGPAVRKLARQLGVDITQVTGSALNDRIDRKSTRLNSSHVSISYAVFCLKKK